MQRGTLRHAGNKQELCCKVASDMQEQKARAESKMREQRTLGAGVVNGGGDGIDGECIVQDLVAVPDAKFTSKKQEARAGGESSAPSARAW